MAIINISRGQRIKLTDIISSGNEFQLGIALAFAYFFIIIKFMVRIQLVKS